MDLSAQAAGRFPFGEGATEDDPDLLFHGSPVPGRANAQLSLGAVVESTDCQRRQLPTVLLSLTAMTACRTQAAAKARPNAGATSR